VSYTNLDASDNELASSALDRFMVRNNVTGLIWEAKNSKDGNLDYSNPHDADNYTPGTIATRQPMAAMQELLAMARTPKISSMPRTATILAVIPTGGCPPLWNWTL
jgi:hypothetical protein